MKRRDFIKNTVAAAAGMAITGIPAGAADRYDSTSDSLPADGYPSAEYIKVRFLGTGAADWKGMDERGELRRRCSILVNDSFLVDYTEGNREMLPESCSPKVAFYTHSHDDHYNAEAALKLGLTRVYLGETWLKRAKNDFHAASQKLGIPEPEIVPVKIGGRYEESGVVLTPLPANHATSDLHEQTLIYLMEGIDARVLYATDTGGLMGNAARLAGVDSHTSGKPITGFIMEATMGVDHPDDRRIFNHSSVAMVAQVYRVLKKTRRFQPKNENSAYITHMARTLHGTQKEIEKTLPAPLKPAYDGLEVVF